MSRQFINKKWQEFAMAVLPKNVSLVQFTETRRAFYAGANALYSVIDEFTPDYEPTMEDLKVMEDIARELRDFALAVKEGHA